MTFHMLCTVPSPFGDWFFLSWLSSWSFKTSFFLARLKPLEIPDFVTSSRDTSLEGFQGADLFRATVMSAQGQVAV